MGILPVYPVRNNAPLEFLTGFTCILSSLSWVFRPRNLTSFSIPVFSINNINQGSSRASFSFILLNIFLTYPTPPEPKRLVRYSPYCFSSFSLRTRKVSPEESGTIDVLRIESILQFLSQVEPPKNDIEVKEGVLWKFPHLQGL